MLPSVCAMLCYMLDVQLFFQPQLNSQRKQNLSNFSSASGLTSQRIVFLNLFRNHGNGVRHIHSLSKEYYVEDYSVKASSSSVPSKLLLTIHFTSQSKPQVCSQLLMPSWNKPVVHIRSEWLMSSFDNHTRRNSTEWFIFSFLLKFCMIYTRAKKG
jgi:hypothetical protein